MSVSVNLDISAFEGINIRPAVEQAVSRVENAAKRYAPVDTGELRSSIAGSVSGSTVKDCTGRVEATADHAEYVEYGTSKMAAQPYLRPALGSA